MSVLQTPFKFQPYKDFLKILCVSFKWYFWQKVNGNGAHIKDKKFY